MGRFGGTDQFGRDQGGTPLDYSGESMPGAMSAFFNAVYAWMSAGLALTAVVAWWVSTRPDALHTIFSGGTFLLLFVVELVLVGVISAATQRLNAAAATVLFMLFAAINGLTLSGIFVVYAMSSIASTFVASAAMFGAMSLYGATTKRDLTSLGRILFMALIGLIIATFVNIFFFAGVRSWIISYVGVAIFAGLTAYDTQRLRALANATASNGAMAARYAVNGALMLYLDFLNLFLFLLQIMGKQRR